MAGADRGDGSSSRRAPLPRAALPRAPLARKGARRASPVTPAQRLPPAAPSEPLSSDPADLPPIITRGLTKRYESVVAVDRLDLEVRAGEIFGLLGQNGAGKTTTILMLLGLTEPTRGQARVAGYDPTRKPLEVKRRVGYLPDAVGFYSAMTGRENLRYTARLNGIGRRDAAARIETALDEVGMSGRADDRVATYSRGMLQRLGIADALVKDPAVLILDEPTTAIDPLGVVEILDLLRRLARDRGMAILLSSHLLTQVQSVCDRVGIFAAGRLIGVGTVAELASQFGEPDDRIEVEFDLGDIAAREDGVGAAVRERERIRKALEAVEDVIEVVPAHRPLEPWLVRARSGTSSHVRGEILVIAAREHLPLTSIREIVSSLDDIYRRALEERGLAGGGRVAA
jgi:ABC-2 type transport system ATP-binding protein